ncbi:putative 39S ribosomal protein L43, mitochondrial [Apostichopus japonicus]|uniref:Large ribosomal subunit protein mL43 n=1 Tax=Stichopus japonicus TaxID=307972 RepID=A0A2G8KWN0_STIJA|nr:putative 39S ribosomal protein L43, mitochondrial [Apostichopus japonicus]
MVRDYIEENLVEFAEKNPQIVLYVTPHSKYQSPKIVAEYLYGSISKVDVVKQEREEIAKAMELLRTQSGQEDLKTIRPWRTNNPSMQGIWHPFLHKPQEINLDTFPNDKPTKRAHYQRHEILQNMSQDLQEELKQLKVKSSQAKRKESENNV